MKQILVLFFILFSVDAFSWGAKGHRVVGEIAKLYLNKNTQKEVNKILGTKDLADISNWPDQIKSYKKYRSYGIWHYATVEDHEDYHAPKNRYDGLAIETLSEGISLLDKGETLKGFDEKQTLAWLVHLIGDVHQPLHIGRPGTRGGNDVYVFFFDKKRKLHQVWDTDIIEQANLSYTEMAKEIIREAKEKGWPVGGEPKDWANESISLRNYPYDFIVEKMEKPGDAPEKLKPISEIRELIKTRSYKPKDKDLPRLSYPYQERNYKLVKQRLFQAGVRLAETINRIYYKPMTKKGPRK